MTCRPGLSGGVLAYRAGNAAPVESTQFARFQVEATMKSFALAFSISVFFLGSAVAQELQRFSFDIGGGFIQPVGNTGRQLNEGWNVGGGFGVNLNPYVGAMVDLGYNSFGINAATLSNIGVPGGGVHIFSATLGTC